MPMNKGKIGFLNNRTTYIDALKGIAICSVVMAHTGAGDLSFFMGTIGRIGRNGVQLFFVISAMLTFSSLERRYQNDSGARFGTFKWIVKRFLCLAPLFYIAIVMYTIITGGSQYWLGSEGNVTGYNILSHFTFTHGLYPHYVNSIIGAEWYLGVLAIFYIFAPVLYKIISSLERSILFTLLCIMLSSGINVILYNRIPQVEDSYIYWEYLVTFSFFAQLPVLALGINVFYVLKQHTLPELKEKRLLSYTFLAITLMMVWGQANGANRLYGISEDVIFAFWCVILIISQSVVSIKMIDNVLFQILGRYSYPIYLYHHLCIYFYERYFHFDAGIKTLSWLIKYIFVIGFSLLIGFLLEKLIDEPCRKILDEKFR